MKLRRFLPLLLAACLLSGCGQRAEKTAAGTAEKAASPVQTAYLEDEAVALAEAPAAALDIALEPVASGTKTRENGKAVIDYSNTQDGYVMVQYTASTAKRLKAQVKGPTTTYTYNLTVGKWATFPLSDGNGSYQVTVYENISDTRYSTVLSAGFTVSLADGSEYPYRGLVDFADPQVDPQTGTFSVRAEMSNPDHILLPGQFTKVRLLLDVREDAVVVPSKAVVIEKGGAYIFVVRPDSIVEKRFIETGPEIGQNIVVERGLVSGEDIVVEGYHKLQHGMKVEPVAPRRDEEAEKQQ